MGRFGGHEDFVGIAPKVGNKGNGMFIFTDDAAAIRLLGGKDILKEHPASLLPVTLPGAHLGFNRFEDKVGGVDLAVGVGVGDADRFAFVLKDQHMVDVRPVAQIGVLLLPGTQ